MKNKKKFGKLIMESTATGTQPHFAYLMNERKIPFMALADYDVTPYVYNDYFLHLSFFAVTKYWNSVSKMSTAIIPYLEFRLFNYAADSR